MRLTPLRRTHRSSLIAHRSARHFPEYAIEAFLLGAFMLAACLVTTALAHPASPLTRALPDPFARRALIGVAMGLTAIGLIYSPWGQRSGAHFNPSVTLTYLRLGKIAPRDALGYVAAQCGGGVLGVLLAAALLGMLVAHPAVGFAATTPGARGTAVAFGAEVAISFLLMSVVLRLSNSRWARWTGLACGALVATYITLEAPLSGMSMNPARSLASAVVAGRWDGFWIYLVAPPLGMLAAAELYVRQRGLARVFCAKLRHGGAARCIFHCNYAALEA
ncbi:MAG: aquaporin [Deltaproteobacteria bacterium]|nr:aquaporin [Deltaproteobacteria bacterium]